MLSLLAVVALLNKFAHEPDHFVAVLARHEHGEDPNLKQGRRVDVGADAFVAERFQRVGQDFVGPRKIFVDLIAQWPLPCRLFVDVNGAGLEPSTAGIVHQIRARVLASFA